MFLRRLLFRSGFWLALIGGGAAVFYAGRLSVTGTASAARSPDKLPGREAAAFVKPEASRQPAMSSTSGWEAEWNELNGRPSTRSRDEQLALALEALAARDPQRAIELACKESNLVLRQQLLQAVLRGWGRTDPDAAAGWAVKQTIMGCDQAVAALLVGAGDNPSDATRVAAWLFHERPDMKRLYGRFLVTGLNQAGHFEAAADFALSGGPGYSDEWIEAAYSDWAAHQPQAATAAALAIEEGPWQGAALQAVVTGWAPTDPHGLAEFALRLPAGSVRSSALAESLRAWASTNPIAAAEWIGRLPPAPEQDAGVAAVAMAPGLAAKPEIALKWAESIFDQARRTDAIAAIIRTWAETDPVQARQYAESLTALSGEERTSLLESIPKG